MCHGPNCGDDNGLRDESSPRSLLHYLELIRSFMEADPNAIITIIFQDGVPLSEADLVWQQFLDAGLEDLYFDPAGTDWNVEAENGWPLMQWMVDNNKRLIVFTSKTNHPHFPYQWQYTVENDFGSVDFNSCPRRGNSSPLDDMSKHLFVMNHFRSFLLGVNTYEDNNYNALIRKVDDHCRLAAERYPNFLAVDFVEQGLNGGVLKVVNELNMRDDW